MAGGYGILSHRVTERNGVTGFASKILLNHIRDGEIGRHGFVCAELT